MIKLILLLIFMLIFLIGTLPILLIILLIGLFSMKAERKAAIIFGRIWGRALVFFSGSKIEVIGRENVLKGQALLFVGNHRGLFDIPIFYGYTPQCAGFIAKKELDRIPIVNVWMRCLGCLFIDRSSPRKGAKAIIKGIERIKAGDSLFIFPEGTRSKTNEMNRFKQGSLKLAEKTGCPIIPVALINTDKIFEENGIKLKSCKCKIIFGKPVILGRIDRRRTEKFC